MITAEQIFPLLAALERRFDNQIKPEVPIEASIRPLFSAYNSVTDANVTGDGTTYTVICDTEIVDRNGDYNNATGIFVAPRGGYYLLIGYILADNVGAAHTNGIAIINTSNRTYRYVINPAAARTSVNRVTLPVVCVADMDNGDTAILQLLVLNGALTVGVYGGAADIFTYFQGYLLI